MFFPLQLRQFILQLSQVLVTSIKNTTWIKISSAAATSALSTLIDTRGTRIGTLIALPFL